MTARMSARHARRTLLAVAFSLLLPVAAAAAADAPTGPRAPEQSPSVSKPVREAGGDAARAPSPVLDGHTLDPETDRRLRALSAELRCLVCQNQSLADSNAELAVDLRRQVEDMIARGDSDAQIKTFLTERYGDFVLYRPPVQRNTALLWFGPFALLLVGAVAWTLVQRRSRDARPDTAPAAEDEARARRLLDD